MVREGEEGGEEGEGEEEEEGAARVTGQHASLDGRSYGDGLVRVHSAAGCTPKDLPHRLLHLRGKGRGNKR